MTPPVIATDLLGGFAALGSAAAWAVGSILFRRIGDHAPPLGMNLGKCLLGLVLLGLVLVPTGLHPVDARTLALLSGSGILGIALGDTFFFMALVRLEPRTTLLLGTMGQVFTVLLAALLLGERPAPLAWVGMVLVMGGVGAVLWGQLPPDDPARVRRSWGLLYGLLASLAMSAGVILAKMGVEEIPAMQATFLRIVGGAVGLLACGAITRQTGVWLHPFRDPALLRRMFLAVLVIMFGGFYASLLALKLTDASLATILGATEPLFILPLAALFLKERLTLRAVLGATVAVGGVMLVMTTL